MNALDLLDARVGTFLAELGLEGAHREGGVSVVLSEEAVVFVSCFEADGEPWVRLSAIVLEGFTPSLAMLHRILRLNHEVRIGAFQLFEDRTLVFATTLHGHGLEVDLFASTLRYVAHVADEAAPMLAAIAGGESGVSALKGEAPC